MGGHAGRKSERAMSERKNGSLRDAPSLRKRCRYDCFYFFSQERAPFVPVFSHRTRHRIGWRCPQFPVAWTTVQVGAVQTAEMAAVGELLTFLNPRLATTFVA